MSACGLIAYKRKAVPFSDHEKDIIKAALQIVRNAADGIDVERDLSEITDIIDPDYEMKTEDRRRELDVWVDEIKNKLQ